MGAGMNKKKSLALPLNFLLGCSEKSLGSFELARLADVADLRGELHNILDRLIDQMSQAALAAWFRKTDREILKQALENPDDVIALAKEQIRDGQRGEEELIPLTSLPAGAASCRRSEIPRTSDCKGPMLCLPAAARPQLRALLRETPEDSPSPSQAQKRQGRAAWEHCLAVQ